MELAARALARLLALLCSALVVAVAASPRLRRGDASMGLGDASMALVETLQAAKNAHVPYGCTLSEKMYQTCVSSGGCCQKSNCLFGKCTVMKPPKKTKKKKGAGISRGAILGQITPEREDFHSGFGIANLGEKYRENSKNWERLWTGKVPKKTAPVQRHTMSALQFMRDMGKGNLMTTKSPTAAPTRLFWDHSSLPMNDEIPDGGSVLPWREAKAQHDAQHQVQQKKASKQSQDYFAREMASAMADQQKMMQSDQDNLAGR